MHDHSRVVPALIVKVLAQTCPLATSFGFHSVQTLPEDFGLPEVWSELKPEDAASGHVRAKMDWTDACRQISTMLEHSLDLQQQFVKTKKYDSPLQGKRKTNGAERLQDFAGRLPILSLPTRSVSLPFVSCMFTCACGLAKEWVKGP